MTNCRDALGGATFAGDRQVGCALREVLAKTQNAGFEIKKTYRVFEMLYHWFFVLTKGEEKD